MKEKKMSKADIVIGKTCAPESLDEESRGWDCGSGGRELAQHAGSPGFLPQPRINPGVLAQACNPSTQECGGGIRSSRSPSVV